MSRRGRIDENGELVINEFGEFDRNASKDYIQELDSSVKYNMQQLYEDDIDAKGTVYFNSELYYGSGDFILDPEKIDNAKKSFASSISSNEQILLYIDDTLFGSGDVGLIATNERIYFTADDEKIKTAFSLENINTIKYTDRGIWSVQGIKINYKDFVITQLNEENVKHCVEILKKIVAICKG